MLEAKIILDSIATTRLTTFELTYPRFIHSELMTHRKFCLAGSMKLEFELPSGRSVDRGCRVHNMTIADFSIKWIDGSAIHKTRWGGTRRHDLKSRLSLMRIRQYNEITGEVGVARVVNATRSGIKEVYKVWAGNSFVVGSKDHRVLTDTGWKTIGELGLADYLYEMKRGKKEHLDEIRLKKINGVWRSAWQSKQRERLISEDPFCRECRVGSGINIHHVVPVYQNPNLTFDENNIVLLCENCHKKAHREQGWQEGNPLYVDTALVWKIEAVGSEMCYDLEIEAPFHNFFANKLVVHNSRNAASSRAIPVKDKVARIKADMAMPVSWGLNQKGMQAAKEIGDVHTAKLVWTDAGEQALVSAEVLAGLKCAQCNTPKTSNCCHSPLFLDLHKQVANRIIEPWDHITTVVTSDEFGLNNWFKLRDHEAADPTIRALARTMRAAWDDSKPNLLLKGEWHLPYVSMDDQEIWDLVPSFGKPTFNDEVKAKRVAFLEIAKKVSVGRVARTSYMRQGQGDVQANIELHDRLASSGHWSPFEAIATPIVFEKSDGRCGCGEAAEIRLKHKHYCPECSLGHISSGNFVGWCQYRKDFEGESGATG